MNRRAFLRGVSGLAVALGFASAPLSQEWLPPNPETPDRADQGGARFLVWLLDGRGQKIELLGEAEGEFNVDGELVRDLCFPAALEDLVVCGAVVQPLGVEGLAASPVTLTLSREFIHLQPGDGVSFLSGSLRRGGNP